MKKWLLDRFKTQKAVTDDKMLEMVRSLERYCMTKEKEGTVSKAPACTKGNLHSLLRCLYSTASTAMGYEDAALVCFTGHVFGRASNLSLVTRQGLSISANWTVFLRLVRVKTSEEQALSFFPDQNSFVTCPIAAMHSRCRFSQPPTPHC